MSNFIIQIIRSLVPIAVAFVVGLLASINIKVDPDIEANLVLTVSTLAGSLYYIGVAWLERKWSWFGWLLGVARNPVYGPPAKHAAPSDGNTIIRSYN